MTTSRRIFISFSHFCWNGHECITKRTFFNASIPFFNIFLSTFFSILLPSRFHNSVSLASHFYLALKLIQILCAFRSQRFAALWKYVRKEVFSVNEWVNQIGHKVSNTKLCFQEWNWINRQEEHKKATFSGTRQGYCKLISLFHSSTFCIECNFLRHSGFVITRVYYVLHYAYACVVIEKFVFSMLY